MSLYAQHGWGKGEKIRLGLQERIVNGVILSPRDEQPGELVSFGNELANFQPRPNVMMDPQIYVSLLRGANDGNLPDYPYYQPNLTIRDFTGARNIQRVAREAIDFQREVNLTHFLSPTIIQESFTDRTSQIALSLAQETIEYWGGFRGDNRRLLITIAFAENALSSHDEVAEFLDTISLFEADGFYFIVDRNDAIYSQDFNPHRLSELLRVIYSLVRARFQVVCGYSDFLGFLLSSVGATGVATGWSQKLRRFNRSRFQPSRGGRPARDRYSSAPLLNSIFLTELDACQDAGRLRAVRSDTAYDRVFDGRSVPSGVSWLREISTLHHWATLTQLLENTPERPVRDRMQHLTHTIAQAQSLYSNLEERGVRFEPPNGPAHLQSWSDSIAAFRRALRL